MESIPSFSTKNLTLGALAAAAALRTLTPSAAVAMTLVDSELSLIIDGSGSIGTTDFNTQIDAYESVFNDPQTYNKIISSGNLGKIAVNLIQFGSTAVEEVSWTLIDSVAASKGFANLVSGITYGSGGFTTNMTSALNTATTGLNGNGFQGRQVIDLSTDGQPNNGATAEQASKNAINNGVDVINVLGIGNGINQNFLKNNIARGTNADGSDAFVVVANTFADVESTLTNKLTREIAPVQPPVTPVQPTPPGKKVPTPALLPGLIGMGLSALRKRKAEAMAEAPAEA